MENKKQSLGIIGVGSFAEFFIPHLQPFFSKIYITSKSDKSALARELGVEHATLAEVCQQDVILLAMPISQITSVLEEIKGKLRAGTLVMDVCSVKILPLQEMERLLPPEVEILGTHPLFGPQSGKHGIAGLQIVLCPQRIGELSCQRIQRTFTQMGLEVKESTPQRHDEIMAYTQSLTHFFSRAAAAAIPFSTFEFITPSAGRLLSIINEVKDDSPQLFADLEQQNPFAVEVREKLLQALNQLNQELCQKK